MTRGRLWVSQDFLFARWGRRKHWRLGCFTTGLIGPKRFGFNKLSSDFTGQIAGTKKPTRLAPCGLLGLHRMTLVITDGEFWWSWGDLNPRPKFLHPRYYMLSQSLHSPGTCGQTRHYQTSLISFNTSAPGRTSMRSLLGLTSLDPRPKSGG